MLELKEINEETIEMMEKKHPKTYQIMELFVSMSAEEKISLPVIIVSMMAELLPEEIRRLYLTELMHDVLNSLGMSPKKCDISQDAIATTPDKETTH